MPSLYLTVSAILLFAAWPMPTTAQAPSGRPVYVGEIRCKQIEGTLCIDSANSQGWAGADFGAQLTSAIESLPTYNSYSKGVIWVKNDNYVMKTQVVLTSPYVTIRCEPGAVIDYQGVGVAFTVNPVPYVYDGNGGFEGCKLTNSTDSWIAGIKLQDSAFIHLWNTIVVGGGLGSQACLLFNDQVIYTEQTDLMHVSLSQCSAPIQFQVTGGTGSFAYSRFRDVEISVPLGSAGAGVLVMDRAQLDGSDLEFSVFLPQGGVGFWFRENSRFLLARLRFQCEAQAGATSATCLKTDTGSHVQAEYSETAVDPRIVTDSIALGTLIPYVWNYITSGASQGQATSNGILLIPNGVAAGYACGANCGAVNFDANTQLSGTYPHLQAPPNLGNGIWTIALEERQNNFVLPLTDAGSIRASVVTADQGAPCTNAELMLSAGWGNRATVMAVVGTGQTCEWTIVSSGTGQAPNPTVTDRLTNPLPTPGVVCDMHMVGGTGGFALIDQIQLSAISPIFVFGGTPAPGASYKVVRRCGP